MTRVLHAAALAFPTHQGTQGALHAMLSVLSECGRQDALLTYSHRGFERGVRYTIKRVTDWPKLSCERSGPGVRKLFLDVQLCRAMRQAQKRERYHGLLAHHVEAALAARFSWKGPWSFLAHTTLEHELEHYLPDAWRHIGGPVARHAGMSVDGYLLRTAHSVGAVSPALASYFENRYKRFVHYIPMPWGLVSINEESRMDVRARYGLESDAYLMLYSGNLDRYQNWQNLLPALSKLRQKGVPAVLLISTASDPLAFLSCARQAGVTELCRVFDLKSEAQREDALHLADVVIVPRASLGGVPIKLIDALSRGKPVIATNVAVSGLALGGAACVIQSHTGDAIAAAVQTLFARPALSRRLATRGREYIQSNHRAEQFLHALSALEAEAQSGFLNAAASFTAFTSAKKGQRSSNVEMSHQAYASCSSLSATSPDNHSAI